MSRQPSYLPAELRAQTFVATEPARKDFGERVRVRMNQKGWTQSELARQAGVPRDIISRIIAGRSWPDMANLKGICKALGAKAEELIPTFVASAPSNTPFEMAQDGDGMFLRINRRVTMGQAARILAILQEETAGLPA